MACSGLPPLIYSVETVCIPPVSSLTVSPRGVSVHRWRPPGPLQAAASWALEFWSWPRVWSFATWIAAHLSVPPFFFPLDLTWRPTRGHPEVTFQAYFIHLPEGRFASRNLCLDETIRNPPPFFFLNLEPISESCFKKRHKNSLSFLCPEALFLSAAFLEVNVSTGV